MNLVPTSAMAAIILAAIAFVTLWQTDLDNNPAQGGLRVGDSLHRVLSPDIPTSDMDLPSWPTDDDGNEYDPSSLIVRFSSPDLPEQAKEAACAAVGATRSKRLSKSLGLELVTFPPGEKNMKGKIASLKNNRNVQYAELDYKVHSVQTTPNDPRLDELWGMKSGAGSNAEGAWANGHTGSDDVVVGIIDSGIDYNHKDLAANMWENPGEIAGNGIDDDGNGFIDDVYGWDFFNNDNNPFDGQDDSHGTHCAGTIGGVGNNGIGVVGVNWNVKMISAKFLGAGSGSISDAIAAVDYMVDLKKNRGVNIRVLSNSWGGGGFTQGLYDAINDAGDNDILFVAAAGNNNVNSDSSTYYPQGYQCTRRRSWDCVISVASITSTGDRSSFSNYGVTTVDIGAPGSRILSTYPFDSYNTISGTSMATPHVSGAIALCAAANPAITAEEIRENLMQSAAATASLSGLVASGGRLDVSALADLCTPPCSQDSECNDGNQCTTDTCQASTCNFYTEPECCGDGVCTAAEATDGTCPGDCCGDGICSALEATGGDNTCTEDCCYSVGDCPAGLNSCFAATCTAGVCGIDQFFNCCGNGVCESGEIASESFCIADCAERELVTTFAGGNAQGGNFFEVEAINDVYMRGVEINTASGQASVEVHYYHGSYSGVMSNPEAWELLVTTTVTSSGTGAGTPVNFPDLKLLTSAPGSQVHSFYVTRSDGGRLEYTNGSGEGNVFAQDDNLVFKEGRAVNFPFGFTIVPRIWNGALMYESVGIDDPGSTSPTTSPSKKPTSSPLTPPLTPTPTTSPSKKPTVSPMSSSPTKSPVTTSPTKKPTYSPTGSPITRSPTDQPTAFPTKRPSEACIPTGGLVPGGCSKATSNNESRCCFGTCWWNGRNKNTCK